jgi:hypothetical protein
MIATIWEVWNDKEGDLNKSADVAIRIGLISLEASLLVLLLHKPYIDCFLVSTSIFFLLFDYVVAYVLIKNGTLEPPRGTKYHWFRYTAKAGLFDKFSIWRRANPWMKFFIKLLCLAVALIVYII